jgi:hypothetical protein
MGQTPLDFALDFSDVASYEEDYAAAAATQAGDQAAVRGVDIFSTI